MGPSTQQTQHNANLENKEQERGRSRDMCPTASKDRDEDSESGDGQDGRQRQAVCCPAHDAEPASHAGIGERYRRGDEGWPCLQGEDHAGQAELVWKRMERGLAGDQGDPRRIRDE
jgi:hypothetical protein